MLSRYAVESQFSPQQIQDKIDDFEERVSGKLTNAPTGRFLIAVGVFGSLVIPCGLPAAIVIALPFLVNATKKAIRNGHHAEYVAKTGNFCHLLSDGEMAQLIRFTGRQFIVDQCVQAHVDGMKLTPAAIELVELIEGPLTPTTLEEVRKAFAPERHKEQATIEEPTELSVLPRADANVLDVQAETVNSESCEPAQPSSSVPGLSPVDHLIGDRLRTALIVSVSGGGKDILLSNALRKFLELYSQFSAIVMDCKDDSKEYGYYADLPRVKVYRLNLAVSSDSTIAAWIDAALDDFNRRPENTLLICNEGTLARDKSKRYIDTIASLVSSGDSRQKYAWEAGQSGHTDDLKVNGAARSRFRPMVIAMDGEAMQIEAILRAKWLADSANDMQACRSEIRRSPVARAWSDGQQWYAMPKLENYAGYDRDARSFVSTEAAKGSAGGEPIRNHKEWIQTDSKAGIKKPGLSRKDTMLMAAELAEWIEKTGITDASEVYSRWQSRKHGFSRPEIRYLLSLIDSNE